MTAAPAATTDLASRLRLTTTRLARQLRRQTSSGLSPTQQATLATIERHGPLTLGELADREQVAAPTISKAIAKLEADDLVSRQADPDDGRSWLVALTPAGQRLLDDTRQRRDAWLAVRLDELTPAQRKRLTAALDVLESLTGGPP